MISALSNNTLREFCRSKVTRQMRPCQNVFYLETMKEKIHCEMQNSYVIKVKYLRVIYVTKSFSKRTKNKNYHGKKKKK